MGDEGETRGYQRVRGDQRVRETRKLKESRNSKELGETSEFQKVWGNLGGYQGIIGDRRHKGYWGVKDETRE